MKTKFTFAMMLLSLLTVFQFASAATATFTVTVPNDGGSDGHHQTNECLIVGNFNSWNVAGVACTKVDATHYTVTLDESTFTGSLIATGNSIGAALISLINFFTSSSVREANFTSF